MPFTSPLIDQAFGIGCEDADLIGDFTKVIQRSKSTTHLSANIA